MSKVAVIGGGSWGTALVKSLQPGKAEVYWWIRKDKNISYILKHKRNPNYLRSVEVDIEAEHISNNIKEVVKCAEILIFATPSLFIRETLRELEPEDFSGKLVVSAVKGLIPGHYMLISDFFNEVFEVRPENFVFLTGPSHAEEVVRNRLTYLTLASEKNDNNNKLKPLLESEFLKIKTSQDLHGLQYAAILKNIYAIASGICHSLGYGDNFQSVLLANAVREIQRFFSVVIPMERDLHSSGYLGDLMVTSWSQFSRNRTFGNMIGRGYTAKSALIEMNMIPEGYFAVKSFHKMTQETNIEMPIADAVYKVLYDNTLPSQAIMELEDILI
jgi:glycerol-3-phosphate dehydrogenase (NAD(P)+)